MTSDFLNNFFSDIFSNSWNRPLLESKGLVAISTDKGIAIIANVAGIDPKDLSVELNGNILTIKGTTKAPEMLGDTSFSVNYSRGFYERTMGKIDSIDYEVKNGYIYVYINFKEPESKKIPIKLLK